MSLTLRAKRSGHWVEIGVLFVILATAAFLRFVRLEAIPPGMTHDEAAFGAEAELVLSGERPIYFALGYGHEPVYAYLVAIAFSLLGHSLLALRATSALCGLVVLLATYLLARRMFGHPVAWGAAAWMAVAFWPLSLSRQGLRAITLPMLWLPAAWWFWRGLQVAGFGVRGCGLQTESETLRTEHPRPELGPKAQSKACSLKFAALDFALSGLFLGASFYTYMASRVGWIVFLLFGLYLLLRSETRQLARRTWPGILITLAVAGLVVLPMASYLRAHPAAEVRVDAMMEPVRELLDGKPERMLRHTWNALRVFSWVGDRFWAYNVPGRPVFNWLGSALFYLGLIVALWRWRDPCYAFLVLWLLVGLAPAMATTNEGVFLRAIVAQPATYVLVAIGMYAIGPALEAIGGRFAFPRRWGPVAWGALTIVLVAMEGMRSYHAYFIDWPSRPEVRNIYNHNLVAAARYLRDEPEGGTVGISALYPLHYHDPWILRYIAGRDDLEVRWFDGRGGIVYPGEGEARYVFSALTPLQATLEPEFRPQATLIARRELDVTDQNPYFEIWRWHGHDALFARLDALPTQSPMWISPEVQFTRPELRQEIEGPARFGDVMALVGYRLNGQAFERGNAVELVTYWRALRTVQAEDDWNTFVHLLDRDSHVIGGVDVLHCPPTGWQPGDIIVQVHPFQVAADARPGESYLEIGVYRRQAGRLPITLGEEIAGDRVLLTSLQVK